MGTNPYKILYETKTYRLTQNEDKDVWVEELNGDDKTSTRWWVPFAFLPKGSGWEDRAISLVELLTLQRNLGYSQWIPLKDSK